MTLREAVQEAFKYGSSPERITEGTFETYLIKNELDRPIAIFKPGLVREKEEGLREYATYLLDHDHFAGVLHTELETLDHPVFGTRFGALQQFSAGAILRTNGWQGMTEESVRRIAILDIRLLDLDRHINNFLIEGNKLIPIDHHLVLPSHFNSCYFAWSEWEQAKRPFSEEEKRYIANLDPAHDRKTLLQLGIDLAAANLCFFASHLLKIGVSLGMVASEFGPYFELRRKSPQLALAKRVVEEMKITEKESFSDEDIEKFKELIFHTHSL